MKRMNKQQLHQLLSQYVDGVLSEPESQDVETILKMDASARKSVEELRRLKGLLASRNKIEPDIGFWTRFSVALEEKKKEERTLLPFPRKFLPAVGLVTATIVMAGGVFVIQNRMQLIQFFSKKSQVVQTAYKKNISQELLPLFSNIDKDRALQFSLFGTLSL